MMAVTSNTLHQARALLEKALVEKAGADPVFRKQLLSEPHAAIETLLGRDPAPSLKIRVIEEAAGEVVLVLPRAFSEDELPDDLLDYAAGGRFYGFEASVLANLCNTNEE